MEMVQKFEIMSHKYSPFPTFLDAFTNLGKATISSVISACLSLCMEQLDSHWLDFHGI